MDDETTKKIRKDDYQIRADDLKKAIDDLNEAIQLLELDSNNIKRIKFKVSEAKSKVETVITAISL